MSERGVGGFSGTVTNHEQITKMLLQLMFHIKMEIWYV